jgi:hypothetical protein
VTVPPAFQASLALQHIEALASIGPRLVGTSGDAQARDYIAATVKGFGYSVEEESFAVRTGKAGPASLTVIGVGAIECAPMVLCPSTPNGGISGEIAWSGRAEDPPPGPALHGKIILWSVSSRTAFLTGYPDLIAQSPLAIIAIWPAVGILPKHQQLSEVFARRGGGVPTACITHEAGAKLLRAEARLATFTCPNTNIAGETSNLIVDCPGPGDTAPLVLIGAHRDTAPVVSGAIDNASGVGVLLELLRAHGQRKRPWGVRFIFWGAEKAGMVGSRHYLARISEEALSRHRWTISIDGLGSWLGRNACQVAGPTAAATRVRALATAAGAAIDVGHSYFGSDSEMFVHKNIPGLSFGQAGPALSWLHTQQDGIDAIDPRQIGAAGRWIAAVLEDMATGGSPWSDAVGVPEEIRSEATNILHAMHWLAEENRPV